jgi:hypothetical protein
VARAKRRLLELAETDAQRFTLHMELGELLATRLGDKAKAARSYVAALELRPAERRILMRLMQLYSDEKDWGRLVEIILKFADLVDDKAQLVPVLRDRGAALRDPPQPPGGGHRLLRAGAGARPVARGGARGPRGPARRPEGLRRPGAELPPGARAAGRGGERVGEGEALRAAGRPSTRRS